MHCVINTVGAQLTFMDSQSEFAL